MQPPHDDDPTDATLRSYEAGADTYLAAPRAADRPPFATFVDRFVALVPGERRVLELGSGGGRDADLLETHGLAVRRSDATVAFVERLRGRGHRADVIDVRRHDLGGPWDGVFANAVLLHLGRPDLAAALDRTAAATGPGGVLAFSVKEGDGEEWHDRRLGLPRHFTYWRADDLRAAIDTSPWTLDSLVADRAGREPWLLVTCTLGQGQPSPSR